MKELIQRLLGKGEFATPKFFKRMKIAALIPILTGIIKIFTNDETEQIAAEAVNTATGITEQSIEGYNAISESPQPILTAVLVSFGIGMFIASTAAKKGSPKKYQ